ncbi:MAG: DUF3841 domain-containing protein [Acidimicrobiia bacterium]
MELPIGAETSLAAYDALPARMPRFAVPRRTSDGLLGETLTLHTIQTSDAWRELAATGVLLPDLNRAEAHFHAAYAWMDRQMSARGLVGEGMHWLWGRIPRKALHHSARLSPGSVLLTVRVPRGRVLLSDFADWHFVLNDAPFVAVRDGESVEEWESRSDAVEAAGRAIVERTWEAIFDPDMWQEGGDLQATIREIRASDVVRATRIRPRPFRRADSTNDKRLL